MRAHLLLVHISLPAALPRQSTSSRDLATLHYNRARAAYRLGQHCRAVEDCTDALDKDPTYRNAIAQRAECYMVRSHTWPHLLAQCCGVLTHVHALCLAFASRCLTLLELRVTFKPCWTRIRRTDSGPAACLMRGRCEI